MNTEQRLDNIDTRLERLVTASEQNHRDTQELRQTIREQGEVMMSGIAALTEQGEVMTAGIAALTEQTSEFRADLSAIAATTQRQAETADRLVRIVDRLLYQGSNS